MAEIAKLESVHSAAEMRYGQQRKILANQTDVYAEQ
jgi:hypothetical protein